jgi:hypothetical protein
MTHALTFAEEDSSSDDSDFDFDGQGKQPAPAKAKPKVTAEALEAMPPEYRFLAAGEFTFFLDDCEMIVQRKQEKNLSGMETLTKACLVRDDDLPEELRPKKKDKSRKPRLSATASEKDTAWEKSSQGTSAQGEEDDGVLADDVAQSIMEKAATEIASRDCKSIAAAIRAPGRTSRLTRRGQEVRGTGGVRDVPRGDRSAQTSGGGHLAHVRRCAVYAQAEAGEGVGVQHRRTISVSGSPRSNFPSRLTRRRSRTKR